MSPSHGEYTFETDGRHSYHTYIPSPLQAISKLTMDDELSAQLAKAHRLLGKLDGMFGYIPDMDILAYPLAHYEAKCSYEIEKQEALFNERFFAEPLKTSDDRIFAAYVNALHRNVETFSEADNLFGSLRSTHHQMFGVDYDDAGQFRAAQLFTYPRATVRGGHPYYNPPNPIEMQIAMSDLSNYVNTPYEFDRLVQIALVYYQLAIIRPFSVGNGLIERICVNFLLVKMGLLSRPLLCLSEVLFDSDVEFRDALRLIRDFERDLDVWIKFFLKMLIIAAEKTDKILDELYRLRASDLAKLRVYEKPSPLLLMLYEYLWTLPVVEARNMIPVLNVSYNTVTKAMNTLCRLGILEKLDLKTRYRKFGYRRLLDYYPILSRIE